MAAKAVETRAKVKARARKAKARTKESQKVKDVTIAESATNMVTGAMSAQ